MSLSDSGTGPSPADRVPAPHQPHTPRRVVRSALSSVVGGSMPSSISGSDFGNHSRSHSAATEMTITPHGNATSAPSSRPVSPGLTHHQHPGRHPQFLPQATRRASPSASAKRPQTQTNTVRPYSRAEVICTLNEENQELRNDLARTIAMLKAVRAQQLASPSPLRQKTMLLLDMEAQQRRLIEDSMESEVALHAAMLKAGLEDRKRLEERYLQELVSVGEEGEEQMASMQRQFAVEQAELRQEVEKWRRLACPASETTEVQTELCSFSFDQETTAAAQPDTAWPTTHPSGTAGRVIRGPLSSPTVSYSATSASTGSAPRVAGIIDAINRFDHSKQIQCSAADIPDAQRSVATQCVPWADANTEEDDGPISRPVWVDLSRAPRCGQWVIPLDMDAQKEEQQVAEGTAPSSSCDQRQQRIQEEFDMSANAGFCTHMLQVDFWLSGTLPLMEALHTTACEALLASCAPREQRTVCVGTPNVLCVDKGTWCTQARQPPGRPLLAAGKGESTLPPAEDPFDGESLSMDVINEYLNPCVQLQKAEENLAEVQQQNKRLRFDVSRSALHLRAALGQVASIEGEKKRLLALVNKFSTEAAAAKNALDTLTRELAIVDDDDYMGTPVAARTPPPAAAAAATPPPQEGEEESGSSLLEKIADGASPSALRPPPRPTSRAVNEEKAALNDPEEAKRALRALSAEALVALVLQERQTFFDALSEAEKSASDAVQSSAPEGNHYLASRVAEFDGYPISSTHHHQPSTNADVESLRFALGVEIATLKEAFKRLPMAATLLQGVIQSLNRGEFTTPQASHRESDESQLESEESDQYPAPPPHTTHRTPVRGLRHQSATLSYATMQKLDSSFSIVREVIAGLKKGASWDMVRECLPQLPSNERGGAAGASASSQPRRRQSKAATPTPGGFPSQMTWTSRASPERRKSLSDSPKMTKTPPPSGGGVAPRPGSTTPRISLVERQSLLAAKTPLSQKLPPSSPHRRALINRSPGSPISPVSPDF